MNRLIRILTITGAGLVAGLAFGAGPAMAATGTAQPAAQTITAGSEASTSQGATATDNRHDRRHHGHRGHRDHNRHHGHHGHRGHHGHDGHRGHHGHHRGHHRH